MDYYDIYKKRLNRYGENFQQRIQNQREENFERLLLKSLYRVDFDFEGQMHPGSMERYKQDETQALQYLLTRVDLMLPRGTILMIPNKDNEYRPWMVWYLEHINASGYNRYVMLKMSHLLNWIGQDKNQHSSWAYMYGPGNAIIADAIKNQGFVYSEDNNKNFFIMPRNANLKKEDYFIIGQEPFQEQYRVLGYDIQSTRGVEYVTVDPIYKYDLTPPPARNEDDNPEDFFWLEGGK